MQSAITDGQKLQDSFSDRMPDTRQEIASAEILSSDTDRQTKNDMLPQGIIYTIIAIPINDQDVDGFKQK